MWKVEKIVKKGDYNYCVVKKNIQIQINMDMF